ncbi:DUF3500 domain-containing protein [Prosthecobacter sp.]|uniref:DUF3500 domain-containing protein n=1 Tax=Prosthecobacter sp. TaxID=1965333 RepID=UPI002488B8F2|nr:DUF3500 domain-containing protein [Prosthecobacter sp.]MDI1312122.1 DUF3500 domain-containing protein [Prosthecobacter sp.]
MNSHPASSSPDFNSPACPECAEYASPPPHRGRRDFIRVLSGSALGAMGASSLTSGFAAPAEAPRTAKPAEELIRELFAGLTAEQKTAMVKPWNHGAEAGGIPTRLKTHNAAPLGKKLSEQFTAPQQDLIKQTFKSILSGDEAYDRISRNGKWDNSGTFEGNGIAIFGDPSGKDPFSWVFAGHHLTLRCDGNSQPNTAFGGPMYYGHSANGHSDVNVYNDQTKEVMSVFEMLNEPQRKQAVIVGSPGDGVGALKPKLVEKPSTGVGYGDLDESQRKLVTGVMRKLLDPFRQEDGDEVMQLIKTNGGMEKLHLAFYKDNAEKGNDRWDAWRIEGPGFVWNYRVLPHVHCFVNVVGQA